jgi:hypothetical protein
MSTFERRIAEDPYYMEAAREADYEQSGWLTFGALTIVFTGLWNAIDGFVALLRSAYFTGTPVFGTLEFWAWVWIGVGLLQMAAGYGIRGGRNWARWFGIAVIGLSAVAHMLAIAIYPWWSLFVLTTDIVILYALTVHWPRAAMTARSAIRQPPA